MSRQKPTIEYIRNQLQEFNREFADDERAVRMVFERWPLNTDRAEVLLKVAVLNQFYSTNIFKLGPVADHIIELQIDNELSSGSSGLVTDIASVTFEPGKKRYLYSFATKYCSWHQPEQYCIYDSYVDEALWNFHNGTNFRTLRRRDELREYDKFVQVIKEFQSWCGAGALSSKQLDEFLWIEGRRFLKEKSDRKKREKVNSKRSGSGEAEDGNYQEKIGGTE